MNDIAKTNVKTRLEKAMHTESYSAMGTAAIFGFNSCYISMIKNPAQWDNCPAHAWDSVLAWVNSGQTLREYSERHGKVLIPEEIKAKVEKEDAVISPKPEKKKTERVIGDGLKPEIKYSVCLAEIGWILAYRGSGKTVDQIARKLHIYDKIVEKILGADVAPEYKEPDPRKGDEEESIPANVPINIDINLTVNGKKVCFSETV